MALIYVLQKDVPGLGLLAKVGMTMRSGADRANEYGGGGWECVKEYPVSVEDAAELKQIEGRVHDHLEEFKCNEAVGFGLTEVFTCSPDIAMAVVKDVVGGEPSMDDEVQRLKRQMTKGVVNKFRKQYETAYAKLIRDGDYRPDDYLYGVIEDYSLMAKKDQGLYRLCNEYLKALNQSGGDDPVFRAMLEQERDGVLKRLDEARTKHDAETKEKEERSAAAKLKRERKKELERQQKREHELQVRIKVEQAEISAQNEKRRHRKKRLRDLLLYIVIALAFYAYLHFAV